MHVGDRMAKANRGIALLVLAVGLLATSPAKAACVHFQETKFGDAYLVNGCMTDMNATYAVIIEGTWPPAISPLTQTLVPASGRKLLWTNGNRPTASEYIVKVFSCVAPMSLVYQSGTLTCQISFADGG